MNKIFKQTAYMLAMLVGVISLTACEADDEDFAPGAADPGCYLYASSTSPVYTPDDDQVLSVNIGRTDASAAETVSLSCDNSAFQCPSTVSFAAGEKTKTLSIPFSLEIGAKQSVSISVAPDASTVYGADTLTLSVMRDYNWEDAGYGTLKEGIYDKKGTVYVQHAKGTHLYKLVQPYYNLFEQAKETDLPSGDDFKFTFDGTTLSVEDGYFYPDNSLSIIPYYFIYNSAKYPDYCNCSVDGKTLTFNELLTDGTDLYLASLVFDWESGFPE